MVGALRNLPVTTVPSTAHETYLSLQGMKSGTHEVVGLDGVLVEEDCAAVQSHVVTEARVCLHADHMPRAVEVTCQQTRVRPRFGPGFQERSSSLSDGLLFLWSCRQAGTTGRWSGARERSGPGLRSR